MTYHEEKSQKKLIQHSLTVQNMWLEVMFLNKLFRCGIR